MYREESSKRDDVYTFKDRLYQDPALMYAKLLDEILPKTMAISAQDAETGTFPLGAHLVYFPNRRVQGLAVDGAELSHVPDDFPLAKDYQEWEMAKQQAQEQGQEGEEDAGGGESVPGGIRVWRGAVTKFKRGWRKAVCFRHPTPPVLYCREKAIPDERRSRSSIAAMMDADAADAADSDPSITFHDQTAATETGGGKEAGMKKTATTTTTKMVNVERVYSTGYAWRQRKGEKRLGTLPSSIWCEETRKLAFVSPTASAEAEKRIIRCTSPFPSPPYLLSSSCSLCKESKRKADNILIGPYVPSFVYKTSLRYRHLFQFSALTYNSHFIHLHPEKAIVQGPLLQSIMLRAVEHTLRVMGVREDGRKPLSQRGRRKQVEEISYTNLRMVKVGDVITVCVRRPGYTFTKGVSVSTSSSSSSSAENMAETEAEAEAETQAEPEPEPESETGDEITGHQFKEREVRRDPAGRIQIPPLESETWNVWIELEDGGMAVKGSVVVF
jgi:hypothetical protein